jgi:asparagine synthase (glutamine-hydrolysing)
MCGIFGIICRRGVTDVRNLLDQGVRSLRHRGPDSSGIYFAEAGEWEIGLAHTRLAIMDLTAAGHQPMHSSDGSIVITFNGEIYNHLDLRRELSDACTFRGHSDTETIVVGLQYHGFEFGRRLRGMYAYAALDLASGRLRLARDPLGIKPLYYCFRKDFVMFASEVRPLLDSGLLVRKLSKSALREYLQTGSMGPGESIVEGIENVSTTHELEIGFRLQELTLDQKSVGDVLAVQPQLSIGRTEACEEVGRLLRSSVKRHLISDVPIGLFLSGGIDSTALLQLMSQASPDKTRTFTVTFGNSTLSEGVQSRRVSARYNSEHHEITLAEQALIDCLPRALSSMDQPSADGVNSYVVSEAVRGTGIKVAISGLGGDEIFCGYPSFRRQITLDRLGRFGGIAGSLVSSLKSKFCFHGSLWDKMEDFLATGGDPESVYAVCRRMFSDHDIELLLGTSSGPRFQRTELPQDATNAISILEMSRYMKLTLLRDCDVMSMAHSLEVRVPFVDVEVVRFVLSLPGSWKVDPRRPKPLLLDALAPGIPDYVWNKRKMGFTLPFSTWIRGALGREISDTFQNDRLLDSCGLRPEMVRRMWVDFQANPASRRWSRPWSLYVLAKWCDLHGVTL